MKFTIAATLSLLFVADSTFGAVATKRGLAFSDMSTTDAFGSSVSWAYNWDSTGGEGLPSGVEFVPMLWGASSDHTTQWSENANASINSGSTHLLGFNEPDLSSQSNLSPADAAAAWKQYMEPFADRANLVSPAISNGAPPNMGTGWMDDFLAACLNCHIDVIAIHIYDSATNTAYYENYISSIGTKYGKPVWVTEIGASGSMPQQQTFLDTLEPFLDDLCSVERYVYTGDYVGSFIDQDDCLTDLGETYLSG